MLDDAIRAQLDQNNTAIAEIYPAQWHALFEGLVAVKFTESQAMELLKEYIAVTCST